MEDAEELDQEEDQTNLVDDYEQFLESRKKQDIAEEVQRDEGMQVDQSATMEEYKEFNYAREKQDKKALFEDWRTDEELCQRSIALLGKFKAETSSAAASLCE